MNTFEQRLADSPIKILKNNRKREKLKEATGLINFNCGINELGECNRKKQSPQYYPTNNCCYSCKRAVGYFFNGLLADSFMTERQVKLLSTLWDDDSGFTSKKGCKIPRKYRSYICTFHACDGIIPRQEENKLEDLRYSLNKMKRRL